MGNTVVKRWMRPLIWAAAALIAGAAIGFFTSAEAQAPTLVALEQRADLIVIEKAKRRLTLMRDERTLATYQIALGFSPEGIKSREGDGRTPEGHYRIDRKNDRSAYHLSLGINYPRPDQRAAAIADGRDPGGDIFIHGQPNGYVGPIISTDWTAGCAAVGNAEIEEIWSRVEIGTAVEIRP